MPELATTFEEMPATVPMAKPDPFREGTEPWNLRGFLFGWASTREAKLRKKIEELEAQVQSLTLQCEVLAECAENSRRWLEAHTQAAIHASKLLGYREPTRRGEEG